MNSVENDDFPRILGSFGIIPVRVEPCGDVYRVPAREGVFCLKRFKGSDQELRFNLEAQAHLFGRGFDRLARPVRGRRGIWGVKGGDGIYFVSEWLEGTQPDFGDPAQLGKAARLLGRLHLAAGGFSPRTQIPWDKFRWGNWIGSFRRRAEALLEFKRTARGRSEITPYEEAILESCDFFYELGHQSVEALRRSAYLNVSRVEMEALSFSHGDYNYPNLVCDPGGSLRVIDFDNCAYDLRVDDLIRLVRRNSHWEVDRALFILSNYHSVRPISAAEWSVVAAALIFPHEFCWAANLYSTRGKEVRHILERNTGKQREISAFVQDIARLRVSDFEGGRIDAPPPRT